MPRAVAQASELDYRKTVPLLTSADEASRVFGSLPAFSSLAVVDMHFERRRGLGGGGGGLALIASEGRAFVGTRGQAAGDETERWAAADEYTRLARLWLAD